MSDIEWTEKTWNPIVGCSRISAGCDHCYAIVMANRKKNEAHYSNVVTVTDRVDWSGVINIAPDHILNQPLGWTRGRVIFVNSMSDMFHENVRDEWLIKIVRLMNETPHHRYQILTKRPSRMALKTRELGLKWSSNMWAGVTIEEDKYAAPRLRELLKVPAAVRFVSAEPLLSALPSLDVSALDWVISGGESGVARTVRPSHPDWHRDLRDRCRAAGTPYFFKQWGGFDQGGNRARSKKETGSLLDGETVHEMPASVYDAMTKPRPSWTRVEKVEPRSWPRGDLRKANLIRKLPGKIAHHEIVAGEGADGSDYGADQPASWLDLCAPDRNEPGILPSNDDMDDTDDSWLRIAGL